jgi:hypothetical protein
VRSANSLFGSSGRNVVCMKEDLWFTVALATWSMDGSELVDDSELGLRRRGSGGVSSVADEWLRNPLWMCFVGLRLRVLLLADEPDDVALSTCSTRSRSSCSSIRFIFWPCLLASRDCFMRGVMT